MIPHVRAEDISKLSISPVTFDTTANPGDTLTNQIKIQNSSGGSITVEMKTENIATADESGAPALTQEDTKYSLTNWITVEPQTFALAPGEIKLVTYTIKVPQNAEPGGHYASILAGTVVSTTVKTTGAVVAQRVGALVLLRVQGPMKFAASVESFKTTQKLYERGTIPFELKVKNDGTVHVKPKGSITITNLWGQKVAEVPLTERNVFPGGGSRDIKTEWDSNGHMGRYTATLAAVYGDNSDTLSATTTFTVFPWKTGVPLIIIIVLVLGYMINTRRRLGKALKVLSGRE